MRPDRVLALGVVVAGCAVLCTGSAAVASVEDYVPAETLCLLKITDLEGTYRRFADGPIMAKLREPGFVPEVAAGIAKAEAQIEQFETQHGTDVGRVLFGLLGRELATAFLGDTGVVVAEAESADTVQDAVSEVLRLERALGRAQSTTEDYKGTAVHVSVNQGKAQFWATLGRAFAISDHRAGVERVIDAVATGEVLSKSPLYGEVAEIVGPGALAAMYVSPSGLAQAIGGRGAGYGLGVQGGGWRQRARERAMEALRAARLAVVAVHEERGRLTCRLTVTYHDGRAPEGLEALLPDRGGALDLLDIAPRGAVLLAGCAVDYQAVWECITGLVRGTDPAAAATLVDGAKVAADLVAGVDTPEQLLAELGSQNALFILPVEGAGALPAGCMALRLGDTSHIPAAAETMAAMVVIGARAEGEPGLSLGHSVHDGVRLTTVRVDRPGPAGQLSPTVGLVGRDLVLTSTLDAAHELVDSARAGETVDLPTAPGTPFVAAALDCPAALRLLEQHKEAFVREVAESEGKPEEVVRRELQAVTRLLSLLSRIAVTGSYSEGRTDLVLAVEPAQMSG